MAKKKRYIPSAKHFKKQRDSLKHHHVGKIAASALTITNITISDDVTLYTAPKEIEEEFHDIHHKFSQDPQRYIEPLERLIAVHPEFPVLWNYLSLAYIAQGEQEKALFYIEEGYRQHPDYLFARTAYANICMARNEVEKVVDVFDGCFDLTQLYPDRHVFHTTEVVEFYYCIGRYLCAMGNAKPAYVCCDMLQRIAPECPYTLQLTRTLASRFGVLMGNI
jgi:tetratricopeptide (TPR) repeat protein